MAEKDLKELEQKIEQAQKNPTKKEASLPKGWYLYDAVKLEHGKGNDLKRGEVVKTVKLSEDSADELNIHKFNTKIEYVKK